jgi:hypothetical protein
MLQQFAREQFRIICAWCQAEMRAPQAHNTEKAPESHGICKSCALQLGMPAEALNRMKF